MDNIDGQRKLTSHDSSQNEQQDGANHGDDRERQSEETKTRESAQLAPESLRVTSTNSVIMITNPVIIIEPI